MCLQCSCSGCPFGFKREEFEHNFFGHPETEDSGATAAVADGTATAAGGGDDDLDEKQGLLILDDEVPSRTHTNVANGDLSVANPSENDVVGRASEDSDELVDGGGSKTEAKKEALSRTQTNPALNRALSVADSSGNVGRASVKGDEDLARNEN